MKPKSQNQILALAAGLLFLSSCASTAYIEKAKGADLSKYKTYNWVDPEKANQGKAERRQEITAQNIRYAVDEQLQKSGWTLTEKNPDVLVSTDMAIEKNRREQNDPVYSRPFARTYFNRFTGRLSTFYYPSQFMGFDRYSTTVKEGTVTVTMIDAKTDKAVWQGWATNELSSDNISDKEISRNVQSIFKKFNTNN